MDFISVHSILWQMLKYVLMSTKSKIVSYFTVEEMWIHILVGLCDSNINDTC